MEQGRSFVPFLVDPTAVTSKGVGIIGISTGASTYRKNKQTQRLEGDIKLGTLSQSNEDERLIPSENSLTQLVCDVSEPELVEYIASVNDSLRILENYINSGYSIRNFHNYQIHNPRRQSVAEWDTSVPTTIVPLL